MKKTIEILPPMRQPPELEMVVKKLDGEVEILIYSRGDMRIAFRCESDTAMEMAETIKQAATL